MNEQVFLCCERKNRSIFSSIVCIVFSMNTQRPPRINTVLVVSFFYNFLLFLQKCSCVGDVS